MPFVNGLLSGCYNERISAYDWWGGLSIILISQISYCVNIGHLYMECLSYKIIVLLITGKIMSYIPIRTERTSHYDWTRVSLRLIVVEHPVGCHTGSCPLSQGLAKVSSLSSSRLNLSFVLSVFTVFLLFFD